MKYVSCNDPLDVERLSSPLLYLLAEKKHTHTKKHLSQSISVFLENYERDLSKPTTRAVAFRFY